MSKEESKLDPFENAVDGGTPEGSLIAIRQTYEIELKFRDDMIFELKKYVEELKLLFKTFKEAITKGDGLYSDMYWEPSELTPYQRALKELSELRKDNEEALRSRNYWHDESVKQMELVSELRDEIKRLQSVM